MLFIVQILVSAACISTAEAKTTIHVLPATAHCQNVSMSDSDVKNHTVCTHCDMPDSAVSPHPIALSDVADVLLAVIALPHAPELSSLARMDAVAEYASSCSSTLLYQTTRRILI